MNQIKFQESHFNQQENNQKLYNKNNYHPFRFLKVRDNSYMKINSKIIAAEKICSGARCKPRKEVLCALQSGLSLNVNNLCKVNRYRTFIYNRFQ